jgi:hypothetical protein
MSELCTHLRDVAEVNCGQSVLLKKIFRSRVEGYKI